MQIDQSTVGKGPRATPWGLLSADKNAPPSLAMLKTQAIFGSQASLRPRNNVGSIQVLGGGRTIP
jgi:hypothetical protein